QSRTLSFRRRYADTQDIVLKVSVAYSANDVFEPDALVLVPHLAKPMSNISAHNERVTSSFSTLSFISDKIAERYGGELNLLVGHFSELGNSDLFNVSEFVEIRMVCRLIPFEETRVVYKIFYQKILATHRRGYGVFDTFQGGYRRADDVKHHQSD